MDLGLIKTISESFMCVFIDIRPTCREVAFEQGSHRKEEEVLDDNKAPADPKELPRDLKRKRGAKIPT